MSAQTPGGLTVAVTGPTGDPTVVVHGSRDPLVRPAAGRAVAAAIPGAELKVIEGMGHDLPPQLWPQITGHLIANARRAEPAEGQTGVETVAPGFSR